MDDIIEIESVDKNGVPITLIKNHILKEDPTSLNFGYSFFGSVDEIDPSNIQSIYQSNIIENIYSRLIEYDNAGQIICSLCSSFYVEGAIIRFNFENSNRTITGKIINAHDAEKSLKRIAQSQTNTHGSLSYYLDRHSSSIKADANQLILRVAHPHWVPFVLSLLTSMDFSIIPSDSLNKDGKIIDYSQTSGLYYIDSFLKDGHLTLKANINHSRYQPQIIDEIRFIPTKSGEASRAFAQGTIDMVDPTYYAYEEDVEKILKAIPDANLHQTLQIGLTSLVFSQKAMQNSTHEERFIAANLIKRWFLEKTPKIFGAQETEQYFQSFGQGFLNDEQKTSLRDNYENNINNISSYQFVLGVTEKYQKWLHNYRFPSFIKIKFFNSYPGFLPESERPDIYLMTADSSFDEDISALSYLFSQGIFSFKKNEGAKWIQDYMDIPERAERIKKLQSLHYEMLLSVKVFPLISRPYIAISRNRFKLDFSKIYAGSPLWKIWTH
ncbi:MAG: ABC transporter substrate-binding protein [Bdellovibrio sp.]